jgi:uncharacterized protein (DUF983 family)
LIIGARRHAFRAPAAAHGTFVASDSAPRSRPDATNKMIGGTMSNRPPSLMRAGLRCRCPRCGDSPLFASWWSLDLATRCAACGLDYDFVNSGDGPAVFAIMLLGFLMLGGALILEFKVGPPWWVHAIWAPITVALAFALLRPMKATLIAAQYRAKT